MKTNIKLSLIGFTNILFWFVAFLADIFGPNPSKGNRFYSDLLENILLVSAIVVFVINVLCIYKIIGTPNNHKKLFKLLFPVGGYMLGVLLIFFDFYFGNGIRFLIGVATKDISGQAGSYVALGNVVMGLTFMGIILGIIILSCILVLTIKCVQMRKRESEVNCP